MFLFDIGKFQDASYISDLVISLVCVIAFTIVLFLFSKRIVVCSLICGSLLGIILSVMFELPAMIYIFVIAAIILLIIYIFSNMSLFRSKFINSNKSFYKTQMSKVSQSKTIEKIYDSSALYNVINDTVQTLSSTKTGAIITFQRKDDLRPLMRNGVDLGGCPVTKELLVTIFYPGTRLHDGAVIIKDGKVISASVYYALTTRPLNGKFGSRHRAAIGISEQSDSITVVVSEETGHISIAQNGEISTVVPSDFLNVFSTIMDQE
jgi:diadenylate cyclase